MSEIDPEVLISLAIRHSKVRHHADQHLLQSQAFGRECGKFLEGESAKITNFLKVTKTARHIFGAVHCCQRHEFARQSGFNPWIPGAIVFFRKRCRGRTYVSNHGGITSTNSPNCSALRRQIAEWVLTAADGCRGADVRTPMPGRRHRAASGAAQEARPLKEAGHCQRPAGLPVVANLPSGVSSIRHSAHKLWQNHFVCWSR